MTFVELELSTLVALPSMEELAEAMKLRAQEEVHIDLQDKDNYQVRLPQCLVVVLLVLAYSLELASMEGSFLVDDHNYNERSRITKNTKFS